MRDRSPWHRRLDSGWLDALIVVILGLLVLASGANDVEHTWAYEAAAVLPLLLRRRAPVVAFTLVCLALAAHVVVTNSPLISDLALLFALYAIAAYGPLWATWGGLGVSVLAALLATWRWNAGYANLTSLTITFAMTASIAAMSWLLGYLARTRRAYVAALEQRAEQLERDADQQARIAASAERARIAREMHDVVAHSLSVIVVQADGALYASAKNPGVAADALRTISSTGRSSMAEMRKLLGLLRGDEDAGELAPLPQAHDVAQLVASLQSGGLPVTLSVSGDLSALDSGTGLTVYRVVQEALTNTLKHAGPQVTASVKIEVTPGSVALTVDDDGRGATSNNDGHGHGIVGIRERIAIHEGHIEAGPRPGGGFRVCATIPWGDHS